MATKKKETAPVENTGEKTCAACGFVNPSEAVFCGNCGKKLETGKRCRNCGALISDDSKFCMQCGCPTAEEKFCPMCGAKVGDDYKFCPKCGASSGAQAPKQSYAQPMQAQPAPQQSYAQPMQAQPAPQQSYAQPPQVQPAPQQSYAQPTQDYFAPPPPPPKPQKPFRQRVVDFENGRHLISNLVVLVMSFLFVFIALFAPVEVAVNGFSGISDDNYTVTEAQGVDQSIFQVFDAYDYVGLNFNDTRDKRLIDEMGAEFRSAMESAAASFSMWYALHQNATEEEAAEKLYGFLMDEMSDMNLLGFMLVLTTPGVYDSWGSEFGFDGKEEELGQALDCIYYSTIYSLVVATVVSILQVALAIMSLVFMIIAICRLVRKKPSKPFKYLFITLLLSGIGIMATMLAPNLVPGGALIAIGVLSTLAYIACTMTAFTKKDNYLVMIRRGVLAVLGMIIFFCMTADIIRVVQDTYEVGPGGLDWTVQTTYGSLGLGISGLFAFGTIYNLNGQQVDFSPTSASSMVVAIALGIIATAVMFATLMCYLRALSKTDGKSTGRVGTWLAIVGTACVLMLAIGAAVIADIDEIPVSSSTNYVYIKLGAYVASAAYAAVVFAVIAVVFDFVYSATALKNPPQQAVAATPDGTAAAIPSPHDSVSSDESSVAPPAEAPIDPPANQ